MKRYLVIVVIGILGLVASDFILIGIIVASFQAFPCSVERIRLAPDQNESIFVFIEKHQRITLEKIVDVESIDIHQDILFPVEAIFDGIIDAEVFRIVHVRSDRLARFVDGNLRLRNVAVRTVSTTRGIAPARRKDKRTGDARDATEKFCHDKVSLKEIFQKITFKPAKPTFYI